MRICVVSDIHFKFAVPSTDDRRNAALVLDFLAQAVGKYDLMVLNGDIFDLWFDWKYTIIKQYFPLLHRLAQIAENGCQIVLIAGNHDFWFGNFFSEYLGVQIHPEHYTLEADGKRMLFTHGDLHTVNDFRYKAFRAIIRLPAMKWLFSLLHPDLALGIGSKMSRSSRFREISHKLQAKRGAGLAKYAGRQIRNKNFDYVFMGHSHRPTIRDLENGFYVNSGDWICHHTYVEVLDGKLELKKYTPMEEHNDTYIS